MTVKELIEQLQKADKDSNIYIIHHGKYLYINNISRNLDDEDININTNY